MNDVEVIIMNDVALTTIDNPYDPFTQFDEWYSFDTGKGYNTCGYLARIARTSEDLSDFDNDLETRRAIDEIVSMNILGIYRKVERSLE